MREDESKLRGVDSHSRLGVMAFLVAAFFSVCTFCALVASLQAAFSGDLFNSSQQDKALISGAEFFLAVSLVGVGVGGVMAIPALRQKSKKKTLPILAIGLCVFILMAVLGPAITKVVS